MPDVLSGLFFLLLRLRLPLLRHPAGLAQRFGVSSIPTLVVIRDGKAVKGVVGLHNLEQLKALLA